MRFEKKEKYLLISDEGERNDLLSISKNSDKMFSIIKESECSHVLLDYRAVNYNLPQSQAFNLVRYYEQKFPAFSKVTLAAVVNKETRKIASVWMEIAAARGFNFNTFTDIDEAEKWLIEQAKIGAGG